MNGREGVDSLESALKKSDGVVMVIGHVGHTATIFTVDFCKKNEIPYTDIKTFGRSTFIKAAESLVQN
ncbi:hypothetical protein QO179_23785 [Bacillus stercoris]|nr:hypothetical protein [Bacillus stercoris]